MPEAVSFTGKMKWLSIVSLGLVLGGCFPDPGPPMSEREYRKKELQIERSEENEPPRR